MSAEIFLQARHRSQMSCLPFRTWTDPEKIVPAPQLSVRPPGMMFFMGDTRMKVPHCCADCGEVMAVHEHSSW